LLLVLLASPNAELVESVELSACEAKVLRAESIDRLAFTEV